jgi:hypothetical protein
MEPQGLVPWFRRVDIQQEAPDRDNIDHTGFDSKPGFIDPGNNGGLAQLPEEIDLTKAWSMQKIFFGFVLARARDES